MTNMPENEDVLKGVRAGKYRDCYVVYNRKSTDEPDNQKNSIKYQRAENARFVEREKLKIAACTIKGFCKDGIISERHSAFHENDEMVITVDGKVQYDIERPKFHQLCRFLSMGLFKGVIFLCYDRASRNKGDDVVIRKLMKRGADMRFAWVTYDDSSSGELHKDVDGMMSEHISRVTREKVTKTTWELRAKGMTTSKAPIGYLNQGSSSEKPFDPERAPILKKIFEMYSTGDWSLADLARWANEHGLTTAPRRRRRTEEELLEEDDDEDILSRIPKVSRPIRSNYLQTILTNRFYTGRVKIRDGNWIPSQSHQALIDECLFGRVQEVRKQKNTSVHYAKKLNLRFRGICRCDNCRRVYTPYVQKGIEYLGSHCRPDCFNDNTNFPTRILENKIGLTISRLIFTDEELAELDARSKTDIAGYETKRQDTLDQNERKKKKVGEDLAFLKANKLTLLKSGVYSPESYIEEDTRLNAALMSLQADEQASSVSMSEVVKDAKKLSELLKDVAELYISMDSHEKEEITRLTFSELSISQNTLKYKCRNGLQVLADRFDPDCARLTWLSEAVQNHKLIERSIAELNELTRARPP
jgi:site-specific DNA recombinase